MNFLPSLDSKDRRLLLGCVGTVLTLAVLGAIFLPSANNNENPLPSTYLSGRHGARAAYQMLVRSGYPVERWERPLGELSAQAGPDTVVIFAQPLSREVSDIKAVREILERGGRVLSTGYWGGFILPGDASEVSEEVAFGACKLDPEGLDPLAAVGEVWMAPEAGWKVGNPAYRVQYSCSGQPAVVEYAWQKGHVVWWASSTPLENGSITRGRNLDLFLDSLGPREGHKFYWDESLHGEIRTTFSYAAGTAWTLLWLGLLGLAVLVVFSFSRRSGPLRDLPPPARATPIEFLEALGSLYRNAGAGSTALAIAFDRFRRQMLRMCGMRGQKMEAAELAAVIRRRFPGADPSLEADLTLCEETAWGEMAHPREALRLIQVLHAHREKFAAQARPSAQTSAIIQTSGQERAS
jgi:Domain of unknown function (DUF4350)